MGALLHKFESFCQQRFLTQVLLAPAWLLTGFARFMVLTLPFKWFAPGLGRYEGTAAFIPLMNDKQLARALSIGRAVRMAAKYTPWDANCQAQAIAAKVLMVLFRVPHSIFYGVAKDPVLAMKAHAWVCAGPVQVTGGYAFDEFTVVAVFVGAGSKPAQ